MVSAPLIKKLYTPLVRFYESVLNSLLENTSYPGYNEGTTDHFITIVGRGTTEDGKRYYRFFDPGTSHKDWATQEENRLVEEKPYYWVGTQPYNGRIKTYHLTMVVLFKKDIVNFKDEIEENENRETDLKTDFTGRKGDFSK